MPRAGILREAVPTNPEELIVSASLAMVPLGPNARYSAAAIVADLARQWPALPRATAVEEREGQLVFEVGSQPILIVEMPGPISWSDLEGPCSTSWLWPEAAEILQQHEKHLVVTTLSDAAPIERATLLTRVIASLLATCPEAPGVYWGDAALVVSAEVFQAFATEMEESGPPLYLWVDFRVGRSEEGQSMGFTVGLSALGHMEFETLNSPEAPGDLRERLFNFANYVVEHGPVIKDGDTIGNDARERIRVQYTASTFGLPSQVMRLDYPMATPKKPWWRRT